MQSPHPNFAEPAVERDPLAAVSDLVRRVFGFEGLRPLQDRAIRAALERRDALVVMPTGGGKSLCYQAPALLRSGLTVVVSPLISLMQDQVDGLRECGVHAAMLTSAQSGSERRAIEDDLARGTLQLLYVAPERLMMEGFLDRLDRLDLEGVAIDEAHCISHWGHDFRPEYRMLGSLRRLRPHLPIQAYTATATPRVRADVIAQLALRDPEVIVGSFDRPNLVYRVLPRRDVVGQILAVIERHRREAGIVYCLRRTDVDRVAAELSERGVRCAPYHAGLDSLERRRAQRSFQGEEVDVIVATVAFGMGIDRPDVRFVVHASLPKGVEQYSQETGRAGRDGLPAECVLFYGGADYHGWRSLIEHSAREAAAKGVEGAEADLDDAQERLSHMWNLATGALCRHRTLCAYFGEEAREPGAMAPESSDAAREERTPDVSDETAPGAARSGGCNACDVCLGEVALLPESQIVAQKILSCVAKTGQRFGAAHVTDVLRGAKTERMRQNGHDGLSTYGLLSSSSSREVRAWVEQLVGQGHLRVSDGEYPILFLSKSGVEVLRGERPVTLFSPDPPEKGSAAKRPTLAGDAHDLAPADAALFERLRVLRREIARERGVPPYIVFNDRTLASMAALKPRTPEAFRALKGVGDKKATDLGPAFLDAIAAHVAVG